ncbi:MazF family transcriptional regulator [Picosynechococcus sp. PCC 7003]|uniref:AbrB/MazE/SpoVT family DNA-binding domain-containing protein n=1 Tax=Picosynechococcus sp. PCC 7003 TaxID=374981 RepID=UPI000810E500|nr:AbrB/MazE/SpoVT family DNA-binding domain-containing protein [Picosynechococcus sp. PCC 7003]ANV83645.1 MazF family transcriptional regulator [Picosynechococcus sp. PCC 7003]
MITTTAKWGNSLAIRIPKNLAEELALTEKSTVDLRVIEGKIVITPQTAPSYSLEELLEAITPDNLHGEIDSGLATGNEVW